MDRIDATARSKLMSRVQGKHTIPERTVRSVLHSLGFRFRLHHSGLPGRPDLVLPKYQAVVFVHGCFWHRHSRCKRATTPATRRSFWLAKFHANRLRDRRVQRQLVQLGWKVIIVWECELTDTKAIGKRLQKELRASK